MGSAAVGPTLSVRQLLSGSPQTAKEDVDKHLDVLVTLPAGLSREEVLEAIWGLLDIPLADIIFPAWEQYSDVRRAMAETRDKKGVVRQVRVGGHTLTSKHHPSLECELEGTRVFALELDLELALHFTGAVVSVAGGEITAVGPGDATVTASLKTASGVTLIPERQLIIVVPEPIIRVPRAGETTVASSAPTGR
jgi:hypothetical protein